MKTKKQYGIQIFLWFVGFAYTLGFLLTQFEKNLDIIDVIKLGFVSFFLWPFFLSLGHGWA